MLMRLIRRFILVLRSEYYMKECNKLIKVFFNGVYSESLTSVFILFANGIMSFEDVLSQARKMNIDFKDLVESHGLNYELISRGE